MVETMTMCQNTSNRKLAVTNLKIKSNSRSLTELLVEMYILDSIQLKGSMDISCCPCRDNKDSMLSHEQRRQKRQASEWSEVVRRLMPVSWPVHSTRRLVLERVNLSSPTGNTHCIAKHCKGL